MDIDRGSTTVNEERNGKTPANARASEEVPAGIHVRRAEGRPRRDRDRPTLKLVERIERTQDHARIEERELSRLAGCP